MRKGADSHRIRGCRLCLVADGNGAIGSRKVAAAHGNGRIPAGVVVVTHCRGLGSGGSATEASGQRPRSRGAIVGVVATSRAVVFHAVVVRGGRLQLRHVDRIGVGRAGCHADDLTGNPVGDVAHAYRASRTFPDGRHAGRSQAGPRIDAHDILVHVGNRTGAERNAIGRNRTGSQVVVTAQRRAALARCLGVRADGRGVLPGGVRGVARGQRRASAGGRLGAHRRRIVSRHSNCSECSAVVARLRVVAQRRSRDVARLCAKAYCRSPATALRLCVIANGDVGSARSSRCRSDCHGAASAGRSAFSDPHSLAARSPGAGADGNGVASGAGGLRVVTDGNAFLAAGHGLHAGSECVRARGAIVVVVAAYSAAVVDAVIMRCRAGNRLLQLGNVDRIGVGCTGCDAVDLTGLASGDITHADGTLGALPGSAGVGGSQFR
ncbi:hypothetical protein D9M71_377750 [compost metagenome]